MKNYNKFSGPLNHSAEKKRILENFISLLRHFDDFGSSTPQQMKDTEKIEDLTQAYETFFMLFKNKLSFQESDNFEILLQRLQHRFGNPDAGCIDVENAQSLERMLPDAISILEDLYDDL